MASICFIDFETTGVNLYSDSPIQIGAVLVRKGKPEPVSEFLSFIRPKPDAHSTPEAFATHGLSDQALSEAPPASEVLSAFFQQMGTDFCFAGWNISFDVGFFRHLCWINSMYEIYNKVNYRHIDVQSITRFLRDADVIPQSIKSLSDACDFFELKRAASHDALEDARLTWLVYEGLLDLLCKLAPNV